MTVPNETMAILQAFAEKHDLKLETHGEVGFGRPCVGFIPNRGTNYIDYNPNVYPDLDDAFPDDVPLYPPTDIYAYHKHDCMAVLVKDDDYDTALNELARWAVEWEEIGVCVVEYDTKATGLQRFLAGTPAFAFRRCADIVEVN